MSNQGPACATCRKKCRKCDRTRPVCQRCIDRGLECGGYPDKFRFCGVASRGKHRGENPFSSSSSTTMSSSNESGFPSNPSTASGTPPLANTSTPLTSLSLASFPSPAGSSPAESQSQLQLERIESQSTDYGSVHSPDTSHQLEELLMAPHANELLMYFDQEICPHEIVGRDQFGNPFRENFLPLVNEHAGVLHAVLGVSASHRDLARGTIKQLEAEALEHRLQAILTLSKLLDREKQNLLRPSEQDALLAIMVILVLHDLTESGISSHGAHLTGATYMCERLIINDGLVQRKRTLYLLSYLAWMDLMRGFSEPRKVTFSQESRMKIVAASGNSFAIMAGCPRDIFLAMGDILSAAKEHVTGLMPSMEFRQILAEREQYLRKWDADKYQYPTDDPQWRLLGNAFRHALLLRLLRLPDWSEKPSSSADIQHSVSVILDAASAIPETSPLMNGLTLPLFMAGADSLAPYQRHYIRMRLQHIQIGTNHKNGTHEILDRIWAGSALTPRDDKANVPWINFVHSDNSERQQDFLTW